MRSIALSPEFRRQSLQQLADVELDILVVGGGVVGAGSALDAATRGLKVGLVEARDFASGTSSRSSKLIHGGLRYLEMLDFRLVAEALKERGLLIQELAPHLVRPVAFLYPLQHRVWERLYAGAGVALYDAMSRVSGRAGVPLHRHLTRRGARKLAPSLRKDSLVGALKYYDAQVDDARHTMFIVRTAATYGAHIASRARVVEFVREGERVVGATGARMGGYAEYVRLEAVGIARVPDGLTLPDAVGVTEGGLTALPFLRDQARLVPGQRVLVNGASGCVGAAAVQLAADLGAEVVGVCSAGSAELVRSLGAAAVIDYTAEDFTAARGAYDVVFDTVASSSFRRCRGALRPGGVYLTTAPSPVAAVQSLLTRGARRRVRLAFTGLRPQADKAADMTVLFGLVVEGRIRAVADRTYPLVDAAEAHRLVDSRHKRGTVVLVP